MFYHRGKTFYQTGQRKKKNYQTVKIHFNLYVNGTLDH